MIVIIPHKLLHLRNVLAGKSSKLLIHTITSYSERKGDDWGDSKLGKQLMELGEQWATVNPEVAAAMEELKGDTSPPKDPKWKGFTKYIFSRSTNILAVFIASILGIIRRLYPRRIIS